MNPITYIFLLTNICISNCLVKDLGLIQSYFEEKSTKNAAVFGCFNKTEQVILAKFLMSKTTKISVLNLNKPEFYRNLQTQHQHIGVVLDGDCPSTEIFLIICGQLKYFDVKHHWLITTSTFDTVKKFENVTLNIDADVQIAAQNSVSNWTIMDIYNPASNHGGYLNYTTIGYYDGKNYHARLIQAKYWNRKNMTGVNLKTWIVLVEPFEGDFREHLASDDNKHINTFNRYHCRLVNFCRDYYNFTLDMEVSKSWGYTNPDGTFNGMVGALERKLIDFGGSPIFIRADRAKVIDYGRNTWVLRATFIFRNPKSRTSIEIFLKPFSTSIWLLTGLFATLSVVILKAVTTFERKKGHYNVETSWSLSFMFTLGAFCQQGSPSTPRMTCGRITTIFIFFLSVITYQFYSASIVSHLLMKPATVIKTLEDLLESPLKAGCEDILYNRDYFKRTNDKIAKEIYYKKILNTKSNTSNFLPPEKGLDFVKQGDYAFHVDVGNAYPIIETTFPDKVICELREVQLFRTQPLHTTYQKFSPFRDMLETCFQRLVELGIMVGERSHWYPRKPECIPSSQSITFNVGLDEFYPALVIFLIGVTISLIILIIEKRVKVANSPLIPDQHVIFPFIK